jgi:predicted porin
LRARDVPPLASNTSTDIAGTRMKRIASGLAVFTLSLLAGAAHAQSNVKLYGLVNEDVGSYQLAGATKTKGLASGNMATSFWGVSGTEDLGSGTKAIFALEGFLLADAGAQGRFSGDAMYSRSAYVGLSGDFGLVKMGRNTNLTFLSLLLFNSFGDSFGFSPTIIHYFTDARGATAKLAGDSGWSNSITYMSPKMAGISVNVQAAAAEGDANGKANYGGNVIYNAGGPFSATVSYQSVGSGSTVPANNTAKESTYTLGAAYDFSVVKLYGQFGKINDKITASKNKLWDLSASVPVTSAGKVLVAYGNSKIENGTTHKTTSVGYDHFLSKRTDVYAVYMNDKVTNLSTGNTLAVGLKHAF